MAPIVYCIIINANEVLLAGSPAALDNPSLALQVPNFTK